MFSACSSCKSYNHSTGILLPIWSAQTCKSRYNINSICIFNFRSHILTLRCTFYKFHFITKPLNRCSRYKNTTFKCILNFCIG